MRRALHTCTALALATLLGGCGSAGEGVGVGEAKKVLDNVWVDEERVRDRMVLQAGQELRTEVGGVALFKLNVGLDDCETKKGSSVRVSPPGTGLLASFLRGTTGCNGRGFQPGQAIAVLGHELTPLDSTFQVEVNEQRFIVGVYHGFVDVRSQPRLVGPDSRAEVPEGQDVTAVQPTDVAELDQADRETIERLKAAFPPPQFGFPEPGDSPTLRRLHARRTLRVSLDRGASGPSERFIRSFLDFVAARWSVRVEVTKTTADAARTGLRTGDFDVIASSATIAGGRPVPFFADESARSWSLHVSETDELAATALVRFLGPALDVGEYGRRYRESFGRLPDYEVVRSVIFATRSPGPSSPPSPLPTTSPLPPTTSPQLPATPAPSALPGQSPSGTSPPPTEPPPGPLPTIALPPSTASTVVSQCEGKVATIVGTSGPDVLHGTHGADVITGMGGNDEIYGKGGEDTICGNAGDDRIYGEGGRDTIAGNEGNDVLYDGPGDDLVLAYDGDDRLYDGEGADVLDGGRDRDVIYGSGGPDTMRGGEGDDEIVSDANHDDGSPDTLEGGPGRDFLNASDNASNDVLNGGSGSQDRCRADFGEPTMECEVLE